MKIGASGSEAIVTGGTASNQNGSDVSLGATLTSVFNGWDNMTTAGWSWNLSGNLTVNGDLPTLKTNTQSPAPTLPAAAGENTLSGNITISPNSGVTTGTQLTATYTGSESVSYQWKKDGTNVGSNSNTFTPTEAGSYTVTVSAAGYTSKTSTPVTVTAGGVSAPEGMVYVSPGTFQRGEKLGSGSGTNQTPVHQVTLTRGFYMARYEVTQEQYAAVMGTNPSNFQAAVDGESGTPGKLPVERVSWFNALVFCNKLSMQEGLNPVYSLNSNTDPSGWGTVPTTTGGWSTMEMDMSKNGYRLPTEAEWEYAAKGGDPTAAGWVGYTFAGSDNVDDVAWHSGNSSAKTHEVGKKAPNALGLYDMSGNVFEWCWDRYAVYTSDPKTDPTGSGNNTRIARGSSVRDTNLANFSSVYRNYSNPQDGAAAYVSYGFRVVRSAQ
jgi:formylglycine-generating enzyme required for sulfatase activity